METPDFYIPIDKEIDQFYDHLQTHPRTILSAKFGDGKSYFLSKFEKDRQVQRDFKFITIYPVNYQVVGNVDVFNLLKYDILLQLLLEEMISENVIHYPFLWNEDGADFLVSFFNSILEVDPSPKTAIPKSSLKVLSAIARLKSKHSINNGGKKQQKKSLGLLRRILTYMVRIL